MTNDNIQWSMLHNITFVMDIIIIIKFYIVQYIIRKNKNKIMLDNQRNTQKNCENKFKIINKSYTHNKLIMDTNLDSNESLYLL